MEMRCILQGEFIASNTLTSKKDGKEYTYTDILTGKDTVRVFGLDLKGMKRLEVVEVKVDMWVDKDGKLRIFPVN